METDFPKLLPQTYNDVLSKISLHVIAVIFPLIVTMHPNLRNQLQTKVSAFFGSWVVVYNLNGNIW